MKSTFPAFTSSPVCMHFYLFIIPNVVFGGSVTSAQKTLLALFYHLDSFLCQQEIRYVL